MTTDRNNRTNAGNGFDDAGQHRGGILRGWQTLGSAGLRGAGGSPRRARGGHRSVPAMQPSTVSASHPVLLRGVLGLLSYFMKPLHFLSVSSAGYVVFWDGDNGGGKRWCCC